MVEIGFGPTRPTLTKLQTYKFLSSKFANELNLTHPTFSSSQIHCSWSGRIWLWADTAHLHETSNLQVFKLKIRKWNKFADNLKKFINLSCLGWAFLSRAPSHRHGSGYTSIDETGTTHESYLKIFSIVHPQNVEITNWTNPTLSMNQSFKPTRRRSLIGNSRIFRVAITRERWKQVGFFDLWHKQHLLIYVFSKQLENYFWWRVC